MEYIKRPFFTEIKMDLMCRHKKLSLSKIIQDIFFSLEFQVILSYRIQRRLLRIPFIGHPIAMILRYFTCVWTSCHINLNSRIEGGVRISHATGITIGANIIKSGTTIYSNVTLGTKIVMDGVREGIHLKPTIGENVIICTGATIFGDIVVGANSIIGANAVVIKDIPANSLAVGVPAISKAR